MGEKPKHIRYVLSHKLDAFEHTVKTSYRMPLELREAFNEECQYLRLSTCFVIRELMNNWIQTRKHARACPTAGRISKKKGGKWVYFKEAFSLIWCEFGPSGSVLNLEGQR